MRSPNPSGRPAHAADRSPSRPHAHPQLPLHVAVAKEIESELLAKAPRFLEFAGDVEGWWRTIVRAAFRVVDDELMAMVGSNGVAVGAPAVVVLALEEYLVLANRGATCRAVIYRGDEVLQLSPQVMLSLFSLINLCMLALKISEAGYLPSCFDFHVLSHMHVLLQTKWNFLLRVESHTCLDSSKNSTGLHL